VPSPVITSRYLAYVLWYRRSVIARLAGSTTFKEVARSSIRKFQIPVPPLSEQERLVELLDEADELRKLRIRADKRTADLIPALFHEMFGDPLLNQRGWQLKKVEDVVSLVNGRAFKESEWSTEGLPIIRIQNLRDKNAPFNYFSGNCEKRHLTQKGAILIAWAGQLVSFGVHIWDGPDGVLNQHIFRADPLIDCEPLFLKHALSHVVEKAKSGFHGIEMKHLTKGTLEAAEIIFPPFRFQRDFAKRTLEVGAIHAAQDANQRRLDKLFQSLLHRAFNGAL
jgi:type I restriction enzyme S subunit